MKISVITPSIRSEGLDVTQRALKKQTFQDFEWIPKYSEPGDVPDLCKSMNEGLQEATGDVLVFLQDFIVPEPTALERIWKQHRMDPDSAYTYPVGKVMALGDKDIRWDWRMFREVGQPMAYYEWEIDFGSIVREKVMEVGGFDEDYDSGFGWENVDLAYRMFLRGQTFRVQPEIKAVAIDHDALMPHPYKHKPNSGLWMKKKAALDEGVCYTPDAHN